MTDAPAATIIERTARSGRTTLTSERTATDRELSPDALYRPCDPAGLGVESTADVTPIEGTVGQPRALDALQFGLDIDAEGYNLFVAGPAGTGRSTTLLAAVGRIAQEMPVPPDWCYLYNFRDPRNPSVMSLPAGRGRAFARDMERLIEGCRREVPRLFESEMYSQRREEMTRDLQAERNRIFEELEREARAKGFSVNVTPMGVATLPLKDAGEPMTREEFAQLPEETRKELQERGESLQGLVSQAMVQARGIEKEAAQRLAELDKRVALFAITPLLNELRQEYIDIPKAVEYLEQVQDDLIEHLSMLRQPEQEPGPMALLRPSPEDFFGRYHVNVFVAHEDGAGAPVIVENNPTYYNLFGRVDYRSQLGAMSTDHSMIKPGALHRANGGFLVLQALDVLTGPLVWQTLKRAVRSREAAIENFGEQFSAIPIATLSPQPIPLDVKVVLIGSPMVYHAMYRLDEDFRKLFRVKSDFSVSMDRDEDGVRLYAGFVAAHVRDGALRPFDKTAIARIVEHGSRLVDHQGKLSTRFIDIADLLTEADYWAQRDGADVVSAPHVERAVEQKAYRSNMVEELVQELIAEGTVLIVTSGAEVGQVNGISVYDIGDYRFGRPSKITASVSLGRGQVVSIEREIQMSGRIHSKGFAILNGYLHGKYAQERPLALSASIGFEQTYDEIDGDSASAAELYALLSAISGVPLRQGIAVTGSVNQRGEVQPIGAVNEKIEGFFAVCKARGLDGAQGVVIPRANCKHLMLKREVVDAVREGQFHVWAVDTVEEGIELLTGVPAGAPDARGRYPQGSVNRLVTERLAHMSRRVLQQAARARRRPDADSAPAPLDEPPNEQP